MSGLRKALALGGSCCVLACSLLVDTADISECPDGQKRCGDCVPIDSPAYGCSEDGCEPCPLEPNKLLSCNAGRCILQGCLEGFGGPDCKTNLNTPENCGAFRRSCDGGICLDGSCVEPSAAGGAAGSGGVSP